MSDADHHATVEQPEQPRASSSNLPYMLAAGIGIAAFIILFSALSGQHNSTGTIRHAPQVVLHDYKPPSAEPAAMHEPLMQIKPEPLTPSPVEPEQEITPSEPQSVDHAIIPADHSGPPWALNLLSLSTTEYTALYIAEAASRGFTPEVAEVVVNDRHWYRVRIRGFTTIRQARAAGQLFAGNLQYQTLWIGGY